MLAHFLIKRDKTLVPHGDRMTISFAVAPIADLTQRSAALSHACDLLHQGKSAARDRVHAARNGSAGRPNAL